MEMTDLNDLLTHEMKDVHSAENPLLEALPPMAVAAPDLAEEPAAHELLMKIATDSVNPKAMRS